MPRRAWTYGIPELCRPSMRAGPFRRMGLRSAAPGCSKSDEDIPGAAVQGNVSHVDLLMTEWRSVLADGVAMAIIGLPYNPGEDAMSKGLDKKKETKKKPEKTLKEKRAEKHAKKGK